MVKELWLITIFKSIFDSFCRCRFLAIGKVVVMIQVMLKGESSKPKNVTSLQLEANMTLSGAAADKRNVYSKSKASIGTYI
jgi:hypothetical protein